LTDIYTRYGKLQEKYEVALEEYGRLLSLLRALRDGSIDVETITVLDEGWEYHPASTSTNGVKAEA
jgi:hypothetical protein